MTHKVLIIDDDIALRAMLREYLEARACQVIEAEDGVQGFSMAERHRPDLIVTDVMMPSLYGTAMIKKLQSMLDTSRIPIVVYSGAEEAAVRKILPESPQVAFVSKSAGIEALWRETQRLLAPGRSG